MKYEITTNKAPEMPNLGKGTECIKLLLSQASKDMYEPLVPMLFPVLGAHISGAEFQYPDLTWKEMCGQMAHLVADSGNNKGQLGYLVEAICRDFRKHDEEEMKKLVEWARLTKTRGAVTFHMYPDRDNPGERLFLQLQKVLPSLIHHQLPPGCKDYSEYYLQTKAAVLPSHVGN
jgi:hypothetical protein